MLTGFRGNAVHKYLTKIQDAIDVATEVHSRHLLRGAPINRTGEPGLPVQINVNVPHHPRTAHIGTWDVGVGNSSNLAVDEVRYREVATQLEGSIETESIVEFTRIIRELEELCNTDFVLPQTVHRLKFCLYKIENMFLEYLQLSDKYNKEMTDFAQKVLDGGTQIVVWNRRIAFEIRNENEATITRQKDNMNRTIEGCHNTIENLWIRWRARDLVARTATHSDGTPDRPTRRAARLDANEILAQIAGINRAINELDIAIADLERARIKADQFYADTETNILHLERYYEGRVRDVGNAIYNFNNRLEQIYDDIGYVFDDSFQNRPDFLRWLSENHRDKYLEIIEEDARRILEGLWHGEIAWAEILNRLPLDITSAESWALAKLLIRLENYGNTDRLLQLISDSIGNNSDASAKIQGIMSFLEVEEQRLLHSMIPLNPNHFSVVARQLQVLRVSDLRRSLATVGGLQNVEVVNSEDLGENINSPSRFSRQFFIGTQSGEETDSMRMRALYAEGAFTRANLLGHGHLEVGGGRMHGDFEHGGGTISTLIARASGGFDVDRSEEGTSVHLGGRASAHIVEFEGYVNIPVERLLLISPLLHLVARRREWDLGTLTLRGNVGVGVAGGVEISAIVNQDGDNVSVEGIRLDGRVGKGITVGGGFSWSRETD